MENQTELKWYQKPTGVIILLIIFFPVGLYQMWKNELWTKKTRWIVTGVVAVMLIANSGNNNSGVSNSSNSSSGVSNSSNSSSAGIEKKKKAYRQGYSDGQTGYGLPASSTASAYEFYTANRYNYSEEDYKVYVMGYNDGLYKKTKKY